MTGEAITTPPPGLIKRVFPIVALCTFAGMLGMGIISPLMPVYAREFGASGVWLGVLLASYSISRAVFMPYVGRLSDKHGRKLILGSGLIFYAIMSIAYMWAGDLYLLLAARIIHGAAGGMIIPVAKAYVGELAPEGEEGTWMGYYNTAFFAGIGGGPFLGGFLYDFFKDSPPLFGRLNGGMVASFGLMGLLNLISALAVFTALPEFFKKGKARPRPSFRKMAQSPSFMGLMSIQGIEHMGRTAFFAFIPVYAGLTLGIPTGQVGVLLTVHVMLSAVLQAPMGKVTDRIRAKVSRRTLIIYGGGVIVVYMLLAPLMQTFWQLLIIAIVAGLTASVMTPATSALSVGEGRKYGMASVMGVSSVAISAGQALGPLLGGVVAQFAGGAGSVFFFAAFMVAAGIALFGWFTRKTTAGPTEAGPAVRVPEGSEPR